MSTLKDILEQRGMPCCSGCGMRMKMMEGTCPDCGINYGLSMGAKNAPGMSEEKEEQPTSDYKLDKIGRKIKASRIVFNQGEDDSTKRVQENMKTTYKDMITAYSAMRVESLQLEDEINEVLSKDAAAGEWISDFVHSDNPKFAGKSKEKRKQMALAAYYAKQRNEEVDKAAYRKRAFAQDSNGLSIATNNKAVYHLGHNAEKEHMRHNDNPYKKGTSSHQYWAKGLEHAYSGLPPSFSEDVELDEVAAWNPIKHIPKENQNAAIKTAAKDVKRGSYADRAALLKAGGVKKEEAEMDEELKGNQHKLDKNKNGKIDAEDFKKLRKEDSNIEEGEVPAHMKGKQKPYVSTIGMDHEVLGNTGQVKATFTRKEHGKEAKAKAIAHLKQHYDAYMKEEVEEIDEATVGQIAQAHGFQKQTSGASKGSYKHPKTGETITALRDQTFGHSTNDGGTIASFKHKNSLEKHLADKGYKKAVSEEVELDEESTYKKVGVKNLDDWKAHAKKHGYTVQKLSDTHHQAWREGQHGGAHLTGTHFAGNKDHKSEQWMRIPKKVSEEVEEIDEAEYKISTAQMGHAGKTTIKHIKNPDVTQRMAAHDVKSYADRIALLKDAKRKGNLKEDDMQESVFDWKNNPRETKDKTKTSTYHDVKKISTGTEYTKQFDKDGTSKGTGGDAAAKAENAPKRGRGRPKKDKFAESVEILMSLSEEQFDSMMEDGFDTFFEAFEQLDEASKAALKSCGKSTK